MSMFTAECLKIFLILIVLFVFGCVCLFLFIFLKEVVSPWIHNIVEEISKRYIFHRITRRIKKDSKEIENGSKKE